jgi:hypothetical protein
MKVRTAVWIGAAALVASVGVYFAVPAIWWVVPNHFPPPAGIW